ITTATNATALAFGDEIGKFKTADSFSTFDTGLTLDGANTYLGRTVINAGTVAQTNLLVASDDLKLSAGSPNVNSFGWHAQQPKDVELALSDLNHNGKFDQNAVSGHEASSNV